MALFTLAAVASFLASASMKRGQTSDRSWISILVQTVLGGIGIVAAGIALAIVATGSMRSEMFVYIRRIGLAPENTQFLLGLVFGVVLRALLRQRFMLSYPPSP